VSEIGFEEGLCSVWLFYIMCECVDCAVHIVCYSVCEALYSTIYCVCGAV
jgi:hypothetical protein